MFLPETKHSIGVTMNELIFTKLWLHLVQPAQHDLQSFLELAWVQQRILQRLLSAQKTFSINYSLQLHHANNCNNICFLLHLVNGVP